MSGDANLVKKPLYLNILQVDSKLDTCSSLTAMCVRCVAVGIIPGSKVYNWADKNLCKKQGFGNSGSCEHMGSIQRVSCVLASCLV